MKTHTRSVWLDLDLDLIYSELAMEPAARGWPKEVQDAGNIG